MPSIVADIQKTFRKYLINESILAKYDTIFHLTVVELAIATYKFIISK